MPNTKKKQTAANETTNSGPAPKMKVLKKKEEEPTTLSKLLEALHKNEIDQAKKHAIQGLKEIVEKHQISSNYNILILHDENVLVRSDADKIYTAISGLEEKKDILLVLFSGGGQIEPAYLISKLCRENSNNKFIAVVPRRAKSAASLICCGADEIHLGSMSELGPIDPQIDNQPALGLANALERMASLVTKYPEANVMLSNYLTKTVQPINIGYYERVTESATQYAVRLLKPHKDKLSKTPENIANTLVYSYKDHGFVIDKNEAQEIFGKDTVKFDTEEYELGNAIYEHLSFLKLICDMEEYKFYWVGSLESKPVFIKNRG